MAPLSARRTDMGGRGGGREAGGSCASVAVRTRTGVTGAEKYARASATSPSARRGKSPSRPRLAERLVREAARRLVKIYTLRRKGLLIPAESSLTGLLRRKPALKAARRFERI